MDSNFVNQPPRDYAVDPVGPPFYHPLGLHDSFPHPTFGTHSLPSAMPTIPPDSTYQFQSPSTNEVYGWSPHPSLRSMSTADSGAQSHGFSPTYRTNSYPSFQRRMTGPADVQNVSSGGGTNLMAMGAASQPPLLSAAFHEPTSYHTMHAGLQPEWVGSAHDPNLADPRSESFAQGWYASHSSLTGVREETDPRILSSQRDLG